MFEDPAIIGGAVAAVVIAAGIAYRYATRGGDVDASVDEDGFSVSASSDGEEESTFGIDEAVGTSLNADPIEPTPDDVAAVESLSDVKGIGETRASDLDAAGFHTAADLYFASDEELEAVNGIGPLTVSQIREDIGSADE